jgi:hypothetical protein
LGYWNIIAGGVGRCEGTSTWKKAVEKTGHEM